MDKTSVRNLVESKEGNESEISSSNTSDDSTDEDDNEDDYVIIQEIVKYND